MRRDEGSGNRPPGIVASDTRQRLDALFDRHAWRHLYVEMLRDLPDRDRATWLAAARTARRTSRGTESAAVRTGGTDFQRLCQAVELPRSGGVPDRPPGAAYNRGDAALERPILRVVPFDQSIHGRLVLASMMVIFLLLAGPDPVCLLHLPWLLHPPCEDDLVERGTTIPCACAAFKRGIRSRAVFSSMIVLIMTQSLSLSAEIVGRCSAGSSESTFPDRCGTPASAQPVPVLRWYAFKRSAIFPSLVHFHGSARAVRFAINCVLDSITVSRITRRLARSVDPVSVASTMASASTGGLTSVAPHENSTFTFTP